MQDLDEAASESTVPPVYEEDEIEDGEEFVVRTFRRLFPDSFDGVIPVRNHKVCLFPLALTCTCAHGSLGKIATDQHGNVNHRLLRA